MNSKNKIILAVVAVLAVAAIIALGIKNQMQKQPEDGLKVGVVLPLTGDWSNFGEKMANGIKLWQKEHHEANVSIFFEDGAGKAPNSINAFNKLVNSNGISACISGVSPVLLALAPLASSNKILTVNAGATNPDIKRSSDYTFTIIPDAEVEASYIANYLATVLNRKECFVYWKNDDSGIGMYKSFSKTYEQCGGDVVGNESIISIDDVQNTLHKIRTNDIKTVFIPTNGEMIARVIRQAYSIGLTDVLWVGYAATESPSIVSDLKDIPVNLIFSSYAFNSEKAFSEKSQSFIEEYKKMFGESPAYYAATCYDSIDLIFQAFNNKGDKDLKESLLSIKQFNGVSGNLVIDGQNYVKSEMSFKMLHDGAIKSINPSLFTLKE